MSGQAAGAELDLSELERDVDNALGELEAYVTGASALDGRLFELGLTQRQGALDAAREAYRVAVKSSEYQTVISGADLDLEDADVLRAALGGLWSRIEVKRGRGLKIEDRTRFVAPDDADGAAGVASA